MTFFRFGSLGLILVALLSAVGCGGSDAASNKTGLDVGGPDANAVASVIEELNEAVGAAKKMTALFVKPPTGAEAKKFTQFSYSIVDKPTVTGTTATCKVRLDAQGGGESKTVDWTFTKDGDKWKISTAPLS